ncbi:hypothetical protein [Actinocrispum sp. NPDC049592]|uniref:hypothetical protein n=1 Tax=Actinocrispum sp. NPDC049592 TaxID=3154835 RepID=UPI0034202A9E
MPVVACFADGWRNASTAERLARDPDEQVRAEVARHPQRPADLRDELGADPNGLVRAGVFARADTPDGLRAAIYASLEGASARDDDPWGLAGWIELQMLRVKWTADQPLSHVDSPFPCIRASAALSRDLPPDVVQRLLRDEDSTVRTAMARSAPHLVDLATAGWIGPGVPAGEAHQVAACGRLRLPGGDPAAVRRGPGPQDAVPRAA